MISAMPLLGIVVGTLMLYASLDLLLNGRGAAALRRAGEASDAAVAANPRRRNAWRARLGRWCLRLCPTLSRKRADG